jgi:hypothetical protein
VNRPTNPEPAPFRYQVDRLLGTLTFQIRDRTTGADVGTPFADRVLAQAAAATLNRANREGGRS